ncbi:probable mitochondrial chaperone bcs1 [Phtheirospermum japonicum]|uniref:Probable mitochondrial chaperone bcs1 n=1 Tax=Phtheirospermum japonicum TaxID=374723 RepID=A0A830BAV4_9LAMI|nr:probable mitochondrial chaperone bcs1 [Phtheirospermum japonicum]
MSTWSESKLATAKTILSTVGSIAATTMVVRGVAHDLLPPEFHDYIFSGIRNLISAFSNQLTLVIDEFDGLDSNEIYQAAETYLGPRASPKTRRLKISRPEKEKHYNITMEKDQVMSDTYNGEKFKWTRICRKTEMKNIYNPRSMYSEVRSFELTFHRKNKDLVINSYLPYISKEAKTQKNEKKTIKIFTVDYSIDDMWSPVTFDHPATFETLAMDSDQKEVILKDVEKFVGRREYYKKVGKAWKRGYLLYGPPGTGKSSLIAAMANYLNFDVYDLELTELRGNSELRRLLLGTANRSILVVEDIDCTIDLQQKLANRNNSHKPGEEEEENKVTLSGLLNFVDGLWSSCGDERIIIFTTNHVEKLDLALLRPGRMDVHINMSYCTPSGFKLLASNYLGLKEHALFQEIEDLICKANVTPAEVAEELLKNGDDPDVALEGLIDFIRKKIEQNGKDENTKPELADKKITSVEKEEIRENGETMEN